MPIEFECACGKRLTAKEEFVGRRLRCPGCQSVLTIPRSQIGATPVVPPRGTEAALDVLKAATAAMAGKPKPLPEPRPKSAAKFVDEPAAKPRARTDDTTPLTAPVALPVGALSAGTATSVPTEPKHPWFDESFEQISVPFRDSDDLRFPSPGPARDWGAAVSLVGSIAIVAIGILLVK
jgi:hypothetical protein